MNNRAKKKKCKYCKETRVHYLVLIGLEYICLNCYDDSDTYCVCAGYGWKN